MKRLFIWLAIVLIVLIGGGLAIGYTPDTDVAAMKAKYAGPASQFLKLDDGTTVHVRDEGKPDGRALVLIHGSNASLHTWEPWVKRLGADYRIISLDLPGHGLTGTHPGGKYDYPVFVSVVNQVMEKLLVPRAIIAGNSMGGGTAWMFALTHPDKVEGLILVDAAGAPQWEASEIPIGFRLARTPGVNQLMKIITPRSVFEKSLSGSVSVQSVVTPTVVDRYWELNRYPGNREASLQRFSYAHNNHPATKEQLAKIKTPVLIMWGDEDKLIPVSSAKFFAAAIPGSKTVIYTKVGHIPMEEVPDQSAADVKAWVEGLPDADAN